MPSGRRLLAATSSAQVYVELDAASHDALSGISSDLSSVISSGKLSVRPPCLVLAAGQQMTRTLVKGLQARLRSQCGPLGCSSAFLYS